MTTIAQWDFGEECLFDGVEDFADVAPHPDFAAAARRMEIALTPAVVRPAMLLARGRAGSEDGAFSIGLTDAGGVILKIAQSANTTAILRSRDGVAAPGRTLRIAMCWPKDGSVARFELIDHELAAVLHSAPLPDGFRLGRGGHLPVTVGADATGAGPYFHGVVHGLTLWDQAERDHRAEMPPGVIDLTGQGAFQLRFGEAGDPVVDFPDGLGTESYAIGRDDRVVPSFTHGSRVATPDGPRPVEALRARDMVLTRDHGAQPLRWVGHSTLDWTALRRHAHLRPILIRKGALGGGLPDRDMQVSPNHRLVVRGEAALVPVIGDEALVAAKHLVNNRGVHEVDALGVTYVLLMFERQEIISINGVWTESYQPGDAATQARSNAQRTELLELFPGLRSGMSGGPGRVPSRQRGDQSTPGE